MMMVVVVVVVVVVMMMMMMMMMIIIIIIIKSPTEFKFNNSWVWQLKNHNFLTTRKMMAISQKPKHQW